MKNIVVSGASGYLGKNFIQNIKGYNIFALCRNRTQLADITNSKMKVLENEEFLSMKESFTGETYLINFAFPRTQDMQSLLDAFDYIYRLYDMANKLKIKKIINISSQSVYELQRTLPAKETDCLKPFDAYGVGKIFLETYTRDFCVKHGIDYINLRLASIIGPEFNQRFINKIVGKYLNSEDILLTDKGELFSFLYVNDVQNGLECVLNSSHMEWNCAYNLGSNEVYTIIDIMDTIKRNISHQYTGHIDIKKEVECNKTNAIDISNLTDNTGYVPQYTLGRSVTEIAKKQMTQLGSSCNLLNLKTKNEK